MSYPDINPNDGKLRLSFENMSSDQPEPSLVPAQTCLQTWQPKSHPELGVVLDKSAVMRHAHLDDFARLEMLEMGKRIDEACADVGFSGDIRAYCRNRRHAEVFVAPLKAHPNAAEAHIEASPLGALFYVEPAHFPYAPLARRVGVQLMAGNVPMAKPPNQLLFGNDALEGAVAKLDEWRTAFTAAEPFGRSADAPRAAA